MVLIATGYDIIPPATLKKNGPAKDTTALIERYSASSNLENFFYFCLIIIFNVCLHIFYSTPYS